MNTGDPVLTTWYVTKYWESNGILEVQGYQRPGEDFLRVPPDPDSGWSNDTLYFPRQFSHTKEEAREVIRGLAARRVKSLEKLLLRARGWL